MNFQAGIIDTCNYFTLMKTKKCFHVFDKIIIHVTKQFPVNSLLFVCVRVHKMQLATCSTSHDASGNLSLPACLQLILTA